MFSDAEKLLLLLLSSRPNTNVRTVIEPCLWEAGNELLCARARKDDCKKSHQALPMNKQLEHFHRCVN